MIEDDGDIVRGLGFVALYAAYLEEQIDDLLAALSIVDSNAKRPLQISRKIRLAIKLLKRLNPFVFQELEVNLNKCLQLFESRNELIHGRIYANIGRPTTLKSGRSQPDREVSSNELYDLANDLFDIRSAIYQPIIFQLPRELTEFSCKHKGQNP